MRVELPDVEGRERILRSHGKTISTQEEINYRRFAVSMPNACGADLAGVVNEAAIGAVRRSSALGVNNDDYARAIANFYSSRRKTNVVEKLLYRLPPMKPTPQI